MPITVEVTTVLSDKTQQQIRAIVRDEISKSEARARPHGQVIDGVEYGCSCGDATAVHDISLPGKVIE